MSKEEKLTIDDVQKDGMSYKRIKINKIDVFDGDTCRCFDEKNNEYTVRLIHIDAPEMEQEYGKEAKEALMSYCKEIKVSELWLIEDRGEIMQDNYDRYLGYLVGEKPNTVNHLMLADGHAWFYNDKDHRNDPLRPEPEITEKVKEHSLGLFANENAIEPKEWRKNTSLKFNDENTPETIEKLIKAMNPGWEIELKASQGGEMTMESRRKRTHHLTKKERKVQNVRKR